MEKANTNTSTPDSAPVSSRCAPPCSLNATPETDKIHELRKPDEIASAYFTMLDHAKSLERDRDTWEVRAKSAEQVIDELHEEVKQWKKDIIPFLAVHAGVYGRDHYGEGCMHYTHYDLLEKAGGRMTDFKRCGDTDTDNDQSEGAPTLD